MTDYEEYLRSPQWHEKAQRRLQIDGYRCVMCDCEGTPWSPLNIHHLTYHNLGHEDVDRDLVTLCIPCHRRVHRMMNRITNSETGRRGWKTELPTVVQRHVLELGGIVHTITSM